MYTAIKLGDSVNQQLQRRIVTVQFDNGEGHVFAKDFQFSLATPIDTIKKTVKSYLDEINQVVPEITDFDPSPDPVEPQPTQAELDKIEWDLDIAKLKKAQELIDCGVVFTAPQQTALANLRTKIVTNFKAEYLG